MVQSENDSEKKWKKLVLSGRLPGRQMEGSGVCCWEQKENQSEKQQREMSRTPGEQQSQEKSKGESKAKAKPSPSS